MENRKNLGFEATLIEYQALKIKGYESEGLEEVKEEYKALSESQSNYYTEISNDFQGGFKEWNKSILSQFISATDFRIPTSELDEEGSEDNE